MKKIAQNRSKEKPVNIRVLLTAMFLVAVTPAFLWSQVTPNPAQIIAWEQLNSNYGNNWTIRWDEETGTPASIYGYKTAPYSGTPENIARSFLIENRAIFNMRADLSDLVVKQIRESHGVTHVKFGQTYNGAPVYRGQYAVHIGSDNRVQMANGRYFPDIQVGVSPSITDAEAIDYSTSGVTIQGPLSSPASTELVIYPTDTQFLLVWMVLLPNEPYAIWRCFVDAANGQVIYFSTGYQQIGTTADTQFIDLNFTIDPSTSTKAYYRVKAKDLVGQLSPYSNTVSTKGMPGLSKMASQILPQRFSLQQNRPNPFNPITTIRYALPQDAHVHLTVYDVMGREVKTLINRAETAGFKEALWDGTDSQGRPVASGMYFYRLHAVSTEKGKVFSQTRRMVLLR